jgi:hypothetical protein
LGTRRAGGSAAGCGEERADVTGTEIKASLMKPP